jgi:hypothetical protein
MDDHRTMTLNAGFARTLMAPALQKIDNADVAFWPRRRSADMRQQCLLTGELQTCCTRSKPYRLRPGAAMRCYT